MTNSSTVFSPEVYRINNLDLCHLTDEEAISHFNEYPHERRIYAATNSVKELLSMRWLRGNGIEIGAGRFPTPLFGDAKVVNADCDNNLSFGGESLDIKASIEDLAFADKLEKKYDFAIASHVLEHADSFLTALQNLTRITKRSGIVYITLPDITYLHDFDWIPYFDFLHHEQEFFDPLCYAKLHDDLYISHAEDFVIEDNEHAHFSSEYITAFKTGVLPQEHRFMHHKHNYNFQEWIRLILKAREFFQNQFSLVDVQYCHRRKDCHFILEINF